MSKDSSWAGVDKRDADLRDADLRHLILFQTDLRGANLYNAGVSLSCETFDSVKLSDIQVATLLRLILMADISYGWQKVEDVIKQVIGVNSNRALTRYLQTHLRG